MRGANGTVAASDPLSCPNRDNTWSDCGFAGITPESCEAKGCCWDPSSPRAWCYHKGTLERPHMGWVAKMKEIMRATWANNNGGAGECSARRGRTIEAMASVDAARGSQLSYPA